MSDAELVGYFVSATVSYFKEAREVFVTVATASLDDVRSDRNDRASKLVGQPKPFVRRKVGGSGVNAKHQRICTLKSYQLAIVSRLPLAACRLLSHLKTSFAVI
jgi:hypothetical protein